MPDDARILALLKSVTDKTVDDLLTMDRGGTSTEPITQHRNDQKLIDHIIYGHVYDINDLINERREVVRIPDGSWILRDELSMQNPDDKYHDGFKRMFANFNQRILERIKTKRKYIGLDINTSTVPNSVTIPFTTDDYKHAIVQSSYDARFLSKLHLPSPAKLESITLFIENNKLNTIQPNFIGAKDALDEIAYPSGDVVLNALPHWLPPPPSRFG